MIKSDFTDTIAAISTPLGEGGIGIVRISGNGALAIADKIFSSPSQGKPSGYKTFTTHYGTIVKDTKVIDEVILTVMRSPKTYTKEDVVEINCHGGIIALRDILELVLENGARLAEPGEFTKRAFLNGRIDLAQAEAVIDVIRAKTDAALNISVAQLKGSVSLRINAYREMLLDLLAQLEAGIDFPEEDLDLKELKLLRSKIEEVHSGLADLASNSQVARIMREGLRAVICGKPNVGKSSLLNALLREERSIVTPIAGTTRDTVEEVIDIKGIPVNIVDTAGLLKPRNLVERKAIQRSKMHIRAADLVILIFDGSRRLTKEDRLLIRKLKHKNTIALINKIDLKERIERNILRDNFKHIVAVSAKKSRNIDLLENAIVDSVYRGQTKREESVMVSNLRQIKTIQKAQKIIAESLNSLDNKVTLELVAQDVREGLALLDDLLGRNFTEDLLEKIFSDFCVGK